MGSMPCIEVHTLPQVPTPNPIGFGNTLQFFLNFVIGVRYWPHLQSLGNKKLAKSRLSYYCRITAIIQKLWAMAWDLLTYQSNENNLNQGVACLLGGFENCSSLLEQLDSSKHHHNCHNPCKLLVFNVFTSHAIFSKLRPIVFISVTTDQQITH